MRPGRLEIRKGLVDYRTNAVGWLSEPSQYQSDAPNRRLQKLLQCQPGVVDRWINNEAWLHIEVRLRPGLLDVEAREFHACFKRSAPSPAPHSAVDAIDLIVDVE